MARDRRRWVLVLLLLGGACILVTGLLFPDLFAAGARSRSADLAAGLSRDREARETAEPARKEAAAAPEAVEAGEAEVVPYGDRNLPQDRAIRGRVLDAGGKPVADAVVFAAYKDARSRPWTVVKAARVRSEADGFFILGPLERQSYWLLAVKEEVGVAHVGNQMPGAWVEMVLAPGASLVGTVTARGTGEPVAGAKVVLQDWSFHQAAETDAEGKYRLAPLPPTSNAWWGQELIVVSERLKADVRSNLILKGAQEERVDFALEEGATLKGRVVDARTLQPVAGARISEGWEPWDRTTETAADGTYALKHVDVSPNMVFTVVAERYLPQERESDGTDRIDFELDASLGVSGRVLDPQDRPVAGARVYLHRNKYVPGFEPTNQQGNQAQTVTTTDEAGKFRFDDVVPGEVAVIAFHREWAPGEHGPVEVPLGRAPEPVDLWLKRGMTVEGEVRDLNDNPLPGIQVQLQRWWQGRIEGYKWALNYLWSEMPLYYTDDQGRFTFKGAVEGQHWLSAYDRVYGWTGTQIKGVDGQRITDVIISFAGSTIEGVFLTAEGEPVPNANVQAQGPKNTPQRMWRWTQTDALGRFKLGGLKDGSYDITGNTPFGNPDPLQDIPAGTTGVELKMKPNQVLRGEVVSILSGRALERFFLSVQPHREPGQRRRRWYGANWQGWLRTPDGKFERPLNEGRYDVTFKAPGHAPKILREVVVEKFIAPQPLYVTLDAGGGIHGTVLDTEGKPMPGTWINAQVWRAPGEQADPTDWMLGGNDRADAKGRFFIEGLADGTYLIQLNMGSRGAAIAQVAVVGAEMVKQDLQLVPTGTVLLRVKDEEGNPLQGIQFQFFDERGGWRGWSPPSNQEGVSQSQPLAMGPAIVRAWDRNKKFDIEEFTVVVKSGQQITADVVAKKKPEPEEGNR